MTLTRIALGLVLSLTLAGLASAQSRGSAFSGTTTATGMFGSRNLGQGIGSNGGAGVPTAGSPGSMIQQAQSGAGQVSGGERYLRDSRQPGQFVGADTGDTTQYNSQMQGAGAASGLEQLLRGAAQREFQNQNQGNNRNALRPRLTLGFQQEIPTARISTQMTTRLAKLPNLGTLEPVSVAIVGRTAVLRGRVATEHDRQMVAQIAMLEPGVTAVLNELRVGTPQPPAPARQTPPAAVEDLPGPPAPTAPNFDR